MIISQVFGSNQYNISKILIEEYGDVIASSVLKRTGPKILSIASDKENTLTLGVEACKRLLVNSDFDEFSFLSSIRNLFSVTESPSLLFPGNGTKIASELNIPEDVSIFDINAGCTGFVDAIRLSFGMSGPSLIVCSEAYSKHWIKFNRAVSSLFSDAAAATYFDPSDWELLHSSGKYQQDSFLTISSPVGSPVNGEIRMIGKDVASFVSSTVIPSMKEILEEHTMIDRGYFHQGSLFVVELLQAKLKDHFASMPSNIIERGNSVSATLPILMHDDMQSNPIKSGDKILIAGFGVGLAFSVCILKKK
jgi:3-oxoacyl-[acyl-carrier-protein] synthase III